MLLILLLLLLLLLLLGRPEQYFREVICFTRDVFFRHEISELPRPIAVKLCHVIGNWLNFISQVQKFVGGGIPQKWGQNVRNFGQLYTTLYHHIHHHHIGLIKGS